MAWKIAEFVYPWGGGHYTRMMRLDAELRRRLGDGNADIHAASKQPIYGRLLEAHPGGPGRVHEVQMPTPIDGGRGPDVARSLLNVLLPAAGNRPLVSQIAAYLREERRLYDSIGFDLVISDGDMGANILARNRNIPCLFVTNQFRPRLWASRAYLYPGLLFVSRQIAKASRILVADSPPPHCICEYNLNFPRSVAGRVEYVGHFAGGGAGGAPGGGGQPRSDLGALIEGADYGYWMRTGDRATNEGTGRRYEEAFATDELRGERRIVSHARADPSIDRVTGADGRTHTVAEALEKKVDWLQIDVGFLSEADREAVLAGCRYAVVNGSHTVMGEVMGGAAKPVVGVPVYDEHTNQVRWAEERGLGVLARDAAGIARGVSRVRGELDEFAGRLAEFAAGFDGGGAGRAADAALRALGGRRGRRGGAPNE